MKTYQSFPVIYAVQRAPAILKTELPRPTPEWVIRTCPAFIKR